MRILLAPVAILYGLGVVIRNFLYDSGILKSVRYPFPVIGVGNLKVGGTGKSPMVEYLVEMLAPNLKTAVLSRGYGRGTEGFVLAEATSTARQIGDEPRQFKQKFPDLIVAVDADRKRGIKKLKQLEEGIQAVILDDAFQHRRVKPGLNILLTVFGDLYIDDFLLPAGRLREPAFNSKRADVIIVTKTPVETSHLERKVVQDRLVPKPYQFVLFTSLKYGQLQRFSDAGEANENELTASSNAILVSGIADPSGFEEEIAKKYHILKHFAFGDHHPFSQKDLKKVKREYDSAVGNTIIITTEKDAQRLESFKKDETFAGLPVFYLPVKVQFHQDDEKEFEKIIAEYIRSYHPGHPIYS